MSSGPWRTPCADPNLSSNVVFLEQFGSPQLALRCPRLSGGVDLTRSYIAHLARIVIVLGVPGVIQTLL